MDIQCFNAGFRSHSCTLSELGVTKAQHGASVPGCSPVPGHSSGLDAGRAAVSTVRGGSSARHCFGEDRACSSPMAWAVQDTQFWQLDSST